MNNVEFKFDNTRVLVVGGSRGIGNSVADEFSKSGAEVHVVSRNEPEDRVKYFHHKCDIRKTNDIKNLFQKLRLDDKTPDIVVNCAATNLCEGIEKITEEEWERLIQTNLKSYFFICKEAVLDMRKKQFGCIVNVSSIAGRNKSIVSGVHYTTSKAAILGLTRQLAQEVAKDGIRVNAVCPSQTLTEMLKQSMTEDQIFNLSSKIPLGRIANTKEQALPILFLCSSAASYITGAVIDVNGGQL